MVSFPLDFDLVSRCVSCEVAVTLVFEFSDIGSRVSCHEFFL